MKVTWRDAVSTVAAAASVVLVWANTRAWDMPLATSVRWAIAASLVLGALSLMVAAVKDNAWSLALYIMGSLGALFGIVGLYAGTSDFLVLLALDVVAVWLTTVAYHLTRPSRAVVRHA